MYTSDEEGYGETEQFEVVDTYDMGDCCIYYDEEGEQHVELKDE